MMYQLEFATHDQQGTPSPVGTNIRKATVNFYHDAINDFAFATIDKIYLYLSTFRGEKAILRDYHYWSSGKPQGYHIVCSPRFRHVLEQLQLPPHRFYSAEIKANRKSHPYFVLHFIHDYLNDTNFEKTVFARHNLLNGYEAEEQLPPGTISSKPEYHTKCQQLAEDMKWLYPHKLVFRNHFNLDIWGLRGQIILSEQARNAIANAEITGVAMPLLKETDQFAEMEIV